MDERAITVADLCTKTGDIPNNIYQYLSGRIRPPLEKLESLAEAMNLKGHDRDKFFQLAYYSHTPEIVLKELKTLRADAERSAIVIAELRRRLDK